MKKKFKKSQKNETYPKIPKIPLNNLSKLKNSQKLFQKDDIAHLRMIPRSQHAAWATKNKCSNLSFEVSAKSGDGVNRAFLHISAALAQINLEIEPEEDNTNILETIADQQQPKVLQAVVEHSKYEDKENENENLGQSKKLVGDATKKKKEKKSRKKKKNEGKDESKIVKSNVCVVQ